MNKNSLSSHAQQLIEDHQALVYQLALRASKFTPLRQDLDDLIGYGMIGLIESAQRFDPSLKIEFSTFAYPRINGAIYDGISKICWMSRARYSRLVKIKKESENQGDLKTLQNIDQQMLGVQLIGDDVDYILDDSGANAAEQEVSGKEQLEILGKLIQDLPMREQSLILKIYIDGHTLERASQAIGMSKGWSSRLHKKILEKLSQQLKNWDES